MKTLIGGNCALCLGTLVFLLLVAWVPKSQGAKSGDDDIPFFSLFFSRDVDRRSGNTWQGGSTIGSEFLGKRRKRAPGSEFLGKRVPGSEFLGKRVPGSEFLGKRVPGSEFLGKRVPGSEFLGKRAAAKLDTAHFPASKRVPGSEFLGKRVPGSEFLGKRVPGSEFLGKRVPGSEFLGKRVPGSEFLGKRVPGSEFLGKRVPGSEFLGKRVPGSEFLGKRGTNHDSNEQYLQHLYSDVMRKRAPEVASDLGQSDRDLYWSKLREALP